MFMITGRDGRDDYSEEPDDGDDDELEQRVYDDAAFDSEDYNDNTQPVSIACENLSVMANKAQHVGTPCADRSIDSENLSVITNGVQQQATGQTHRYEKQQAVGDPPVVEHLSREDIENYLKNETVLASQSCSQEVRGQHVPHINMSFCSDAEAFAFYNTYASIVGFSAKKAGNYHCRGAVDSKTTRCTYRCNRAGKIVGKEILEERRKRREHNRKKNNKSGVSCDAQIKKPRNKNTIEITDCHATMVVTLKEDKWVVTNIELQHNHALSPPGEAKFLRSHKHMTEEEKLLIRTMNSVKLPSRKIMAILAGFRGGMSALPYTKKDVSNYRTAIRNESNQNDMMMVIEFFRKRQMEDPRFYYAFRVDDEHKVQNIFWANGNCRKFYDLYGDCISFGTTYKTNKYNLLFAPFVGITGHANNCLFACAILQNEIVETFTWLFEEFLQCMGGKMPLTIITDQDVAMKQAIPNVFTQTKHRNCLFHIKKKAEEKCARCFATRRTLHIEFDDIINKSQIEEESEGTNAIFKDNVGSTYSIISFLGEYQRISESIVEKEREQDSKTRTTKPILWAGSELELQAAKLYNRNIFYKFQKQLKMTQQVHVEEIEKNVKLDFRERKFMVMVDWANEDISCICARFQKDVMLCCHALKVLLHLNILVLPEKYYIQRWRRAENVEARDKQYNVPFELTTENSHFRYSILSKKMTDLAANACQLTETYTNLLNKGTKLCGKINEIRKEAHDKHKQTHTTHHDVDEQPPGETFPENSTAGHGPEDMYKEPDIAKSKGRPKVAGRQKTIVEEIFTKQRITCSHCGEKSKTNSDKPATHKGADKDVSSPLPPRDVQSPRIRKPTQKALESMLLTQTRKQNKQVG
ncbi:hypothetical protein BRADI_1g44241v3 [Brachypodium distachyon]|uniref:Protein FAR1-RELATED SEQUENCE n=1 Tax=Brachypodium distachyon TaxID=15368 RepID=A0A0Q3L679_BRADI|nr:hypothetical protein BRADI_1g44241v3 [Brachypodium distachyon]